MSDVFVALPDVTSPAYQVLASDFSLRLVVDRDERTVAARFDRRYQFDAAAFAEEDPTDGDRLAQEIHYTHTLLASNAGERASVFGFSTTKTPSEVIVVAPTNPVLNETRSRIAKQAGINTADFFDYPGNFVPVTGMNAFLARDQVPVATGEEEVIHDGIFHRPGTSRMAKQIFGRFVLGAQFAEAGQDLTYMKNVVGGFDTVSAELAVNEYDHCAQMLLESYQDFMHPLAAGILAVEDAAAQAEVDQQLLVLAREGTI